MTCASAWGSGGQLERLDLAQVARRVLGQAPPSGRAGSQVLDRLGAGLHLLGYRDQLERIIRDLVSHCQEHMPPDGLLRLSGQVRDGRVLMELTDLSHPQRDQAFPGQATPAAEPADDCLQELARAAGCMGGALQVRLRQGEGATYLLSFPLALPGHERGQATDRPRVLMVEDEVLVGMGLKLMMEQAGFVVDLVPDLKSALLSLTKDTPDVVLSDLMLPDGTGWDIAQALNRVKPAPGRREPAFVMMTGYDTHRLPEPRPQNLPQPLALISKPVDGRHLLKVLSLAVAPQPEEAKT